MKRFFLLALAALAALPAAAQTASVQTLGTPVVTEERVIYEVEGTVPGGKAVRLWSEPVIAAAKKDCAKRNGELNACAAVCGLNGCFSTCALACEFPDEIGERRNGALSQYRAAKEAFEEAGGSAGRTLTKKLRALESDLAGASERFAKAREAARTEVDLVTAALAELRAGTPKGAPVVDLERVMGHIENTYTEKTAERFAEDCPGAKLPKAVARIAAESTLLSAKCDPMTGDILFSAGTSSPGSFVYTRARAFAGKEWRSIPFRADMEPSPWRIGSAFLEVRPADDAPIDALAAYVCTKKANGTFACGANGKQWSAIGINAW